MTFKTDQSSQFQPNSMMVTKFTFLTQFQNSNQTDFTDYADNSNNANNADNANNLHYTDNLDKYFTMQTFSTIRPFFQ